MVIMLSRMLMRGVMGAQMGVADGKKKYGQGQKCKDHFPWI